MSSTYGTNLKLSIFGQSHGKAIGMILDGIPAGLPVDMNVLQEFLNRRAPGKTDYATARRELDTPEFVSGIIDNYTCGAPICAMIRNTNTRSGDYEQLKDLPRPGHADYTAQVKYKGYQDVAGGGHFSGRLTAPLCIAGGLCKQWLEAAGIRIGAHISMIGTVPDGPVTLNTIHPDFALFGADFPVFNKEAGEKMCVEIAKAKADEDSIGGLIECVIDGVPAGIGEPMFGGMEGRLAQIIYGIPAVKGIEFGSGFQGAQTRGSANNDNFITINGGISCETNHAGGILGGITTGLPIVFQVAIKPTPSIAKEQKTVRLTTMMQESLRIKGRHDPCIVPRAVPVIEAAAALAIYDAILT